MRSARSLTIVLGCGRQNRVWIDRLRKACFSGPNGQLPEDEGKANAIERGDGCTISGF